MKTIFNYIMKTIYTFYRMTHPDFPELDYIGSAWNFDHRKGVHKSSCKNGNSRLYKFIRQNNIKFETIKWEILLECDTNIPRKIEQMFIDKYGTYKKMNSIMAYNQFDFKPRENGFKNYCKFCERDYGSFISLLRHIAWDGNGNLHRRKMAELNLPRFKHCKILKNFVCTF